MVKKLGLALAASFAMSSVAFAEDAVLSKDATQPNASRAVQLSDAQLDEITAGTTTTIVAVFNPGQAEVMKGELTGHFLCVNCIPGFEEKGKLMIIVNPARTIIRCTGLSIC